MTLPSELGAETDFTAEMTRAHAVGQCTTTSLTLAIQPRDKESSDDVAVPSSSTQTLVKVDVVVGSGEPSTRSESPFSLRRAVDMDIPWDNYPDHSQVLFLSCPQNPDGAKKVSPAHRDSSSGVRDGSSGGTFTGDARDSYIDKTLSRLDYQSLGSASPLPLDMDSTLPSCTSPGRERLHNVRTVEWVGLVGSSVSSSPNPWSADENGQQAGEPGTTAAALLAIRCRAEVLGPNAARQPELVLPAFVDLGRRGQLRDPSRAPFSCVASTGVNAYLSDAEMDPRPTPQAQAAENGSLPSSGQVDNPVGRRNNDDKSEGCECLLEVLLPQIAARAGEHRLSRRNSGLSSSSDSDSPYVSVDSEPKSPLDWPSFGVGSKTSRTVSPRFTPTRHRTCQQIRSFPSPHAASNEGCLETNELRSSRTGSFRSAAHVSMKVGSLSRPVSKPSSARALCVSGECSRLSSPIVKRMNALASSVSQIKRKSAVESHALVKATDETATYTQSMSTISRPASASVISNAESDSSHRFLPPSSLVSQPEDNVVSPLPTPPLKPTSAQGQESAPNPLPSLGPTSTLPLNKSHPCPLTSNNEGDVPPSSGTAGFLPVILPLQEAAISSLHSVASNCPDSSALGQLTSEQWVAMTDGGVDLSPSIVSHPTIFAHELEEGTLPSEGGSTSLFATPAAVAPGGHGGSFSLSRNFQLDRVCSESGPKTGTTRGGSISSSTQPLLTPSCRSTCSPSRPRHVTSSSSRCSEAPSSMASLFTSMASGPSSPPTSTASQEADTGLGAGSLPPAFEKQLLSLAPPDGGVTGLAGQGNSALSNGGVGKAVGDLEDRSAKHMGAGVREVSRDDPGRHDVPRVLVRPSGGSPRGSPPQKASSYRMIQAAGSHSRKSSHFTREGCNLGNASAFSSPSKQPRGGGGGPTVAAVALHHDLRCEGPQAAVAGAGGFGHLGGGFGFGSSGILVQQQQSGRVSFAGSEVSAVGSVCSALSSGRASNYGPGPANSHSNNGLMGLALAGLCQVQQGSAVACSSGALRAQNSFSGHSFVNGALGSANVGHAPSVADDDGDDAASVVSSATESSSGYGLYGGSMGVALSSPSSCISVDRNGHKPNPGRTSIFAQSPAAQNLAAKYRMGMPPLSAVAHLAPPFQKPPLARAATSVAPFSYFHGAPLGLDLGGARWYDLAYQAAHAQVQASDQESQANQRSSLHQSRSINRRGVFNSFFPQGRTSQRASTHSLPSQPQALVYLHRDKKDGGKGIGSDAAAGEHEEIPCAQAASLKWAVGAGCRSGQAALASPFPSSNVLMTSNPLYTNVAP